MNSCACPASRLTSVAFAHGVVMQRCRAHETQTWTVNGRPADGRTVRSLLKDLFVETRGLTRTSRPAPAQKVVAPSAQRNAEREEEVTPGLDEQLTALLRARGLQGSWAVSSA